MGIIFLAHLLREVQWVGKHFEEVLPTGDFAVPYGGHRRLKGTGEGREGWKWQGGGEEGQSAGMDCDGDQAQCGQQRFRPCATSQAKHCLWAPQQDQSIGVREEEYWERKNEKKVDERGQREREIEAGEDTAPLEVKGP